MYSEHWWDFGPGLLNFLLWRHFDPVKLVRFEVSGYFHKNPLEEWPKIWHATVFWPPSELIRFWSRSLGFSNSNFGTHLIWWNWGFRAFSRERMGVMARNLVCWCILTSWSAMVCLSLLLLIAITLAPLWPWKWSYCWFLGTFWGTRGSKCGILLGVGCGVCVWGVCVCVGGGGGGWWWWGLGWWWSGVMVGWGWGWW